ncbi:MAG: 30S ribosomal protein S20, partial [Candidatus Omnitrophica bacterium]|nr:30S ribosomal protein S20 [Candidatus Omnitrophota bacterium]
MPQRKSAKKELRKNLKRRQRNLLFKKQIFLTIKKFKKALNNKDIPSAKVALNEVYKILDKAVSKKILHQKNAARKKSKLTKFFNSLNSKI